MYERFWMENKNSCWIHKCLSFCKELPDYSELGGYKWGSPVGDECEKGGHEWSEFLHGVDLHEMDLHGTDLHWTPVITCPA